ncbi:hypothetical protein ACPV3O_18775 [Vibrio rotiferianus]|uniref:hypothetical protein n=1 Tax=Vibrio rotiferianus TaxID=190895 RepID=UPI00406A9706
MDICFTITTTYTKHIKNPLRKQIMSKNAINNDTPKPNLATPTLKHYLQQADWTLSCLLGLILKALIFISLVSMSVTVLCFELLNIFEYKDAFADVSTIEFIFFVSFLVLLKRYLVYTKQTSIHWWHTASTPFLWHGKFIVSALLCASLITFSDLYQGTDTFKNMILKEQSYDQLVSLSIILFCLYLSVPSRKLRIKVEDTSPSKQPNNSDDIEQTQTVPEVKNAQ